MTHSITPAAHLADFLQSAFKSDDFSSFLRRLVDGDELTASLPPRLSESKYFEEVVDALSRHGWISTSFFSALEAARPKRAAEIRAVGDQFGHRMRGTVETYFPTETFPSDRFRAEAHRLFERAREDILVYGTGVSSFRSNEDRSFDPVRATLIEQRWSDIDAAVMRGVRYTRIQLALSCDPFGFAMMRDRVVKHADSDRFSIFCWVDRRPPIFAQSIVIDPGKGSTCAVVIGHTRPSLPTTVDTDDQFSLGISAAVIIEGSPEYSSMTFSQLMRVVEDPGCVRLTPKNIDEILRIEPYTPARL